MILFEENQVEGKFIQRINRFIAEVEVKGEHHLVHVPNTGRMKELLMEEARVFLKYHPAPHKKTEYSLISVEKDNILVCVDSRAANQLFFDFLSDGRSADFSNIENLRREVTYLDSRFDIGFMQDNQQVLIEIKSVNLVKDSHAMFPDAPTTRGDKHIRGLIEAQNHGIKTGVVFIVQRSDASYFSPHWEMDPVFSKSLEEAYSKGVLIKVYTCLVEKERMEINKEIPFYLY